MVVNGDCAYPEEIHTLLPKLRRSDYFVTPELKQLASYELEEPGYCSRVTDFVVGCKEHGHIKFLGETDVRWLDIDSIVSFGHREVVVYEEEESKPPVGSGLNKPAEVTFYNIQCKHNKVFTNDSQSFVERLKRKAEEQGATFVSYDSTRHEWKFVVQHFSRFALDDSDEDEPLQDDDRAVSAMEDDIMLQELGPLVTMKSPEIPVWQHDRSDVGSEDIEAEGSPMQGVHYTAPQSALPHSLPQHLKLDPLKMQQMKMLFFPSGEETEGTTFPDRIPFQSAQRATPQIITKGLPRQGSPGQRKDYLSPAEESPRAVTFSKHIMKVSPQTSWRRLSNHSLSPLGRHINLEMEEEVSPVKHSRMLLSLESKTEHSALKRSRAGFKNEISPSSCMFGRSDNIVDAALFLGCSFRVGWGPHGLLAHSGNPVGLQGYTISSVVTIEQVAFDGCARDDEGKIREDFIEMQFVSPLKLHMSISKSIEGMNERPSEIRLRYVQCDRRMLPDICNKYEEILVKHYAAVGVSDSQRLLLRHQVMAWNLLNVLFSEKASVKEEEDLENEDDVLKPIQHVDPEVAGLIRRAEFSSWLQDSVRHIIDADLMDVDAKEQLKELFALLTGRQLDEAVQLAVTRGDIRLACLLSQAGGSMITRRDIGSQLKVWEEEGFDFNLMEKDMILLYKLLSGDIQGALEGRVIDWKRYLGLLMWYNLAPDTQLPEIIRSYSFLVEGSDSAPPPIPMYIEEGTSLGISNVQKELYDTAYYLMLLYAYQGKNLNVSKMFSSSSSTFDPLDHRMAWFQHGLLEAIEALAPIELHVLDMNFVSQLLVIGECHWAIYVVLHMPPNLDYPGLHEKVIKEILHQYCEVWSTSELQQTFIEKELGIPVEWLHEALGTYWQYKNDSQKAIKHLLKSKKWHRAHSLLMNSVAASLFISGQYDELLEIVNALENNKMELDEWAISGGIFADFFLLKNSFHSDDLTDEIVIFENKVAACKSFFQRLKESQAIWGSSSSAKNRVAFSRMAHELANLLLAERRPKALGDNSADLKLHYSVMDAPLPEDFHFHNLQGAAASFTSWLVQTVPQ